MMNSPDDNTTVFRMMGEFKNYLVKDIERHQKDQHTREREGELLASKSHIVKLQAELDGLRTSNKRSRTEYEKDAEKERSSRELEVSKLEEMTRQLEFAVKQEQRARKEAEETRQAKEGMRTNYEAQVQDLRQQKLKLEMALQELQLTSRSRISSMTNEITKKNSDIKMLHTDVEEAKIRLQHQMRRGIDATSNRRALEQYRMDLQTAQQRVKELEMKVADQEDAVIIAKAVQTDAAKTSDLTIDKEQLQKELAYYREVNENNALLKEKATSLESKLQRAEERALELAKLQVDNGDLRLKLSKWENMDSDEENRPSSPSKMMAKIAVLQQGQVALLEKQGHFLSRTHSLEKSNKVTKDKLASTEQELLKLQESKRLQDDLVKRLQRKLLLLTKERDGMRQILNSYDSEVSSIGYEPQCNARLKQAESNLLTCHRQMEILSNDIKSTTKKNSQLMLQNRQLSAELAKAKSDLTDAMSGSPLQPFNTSVFEYPDRDEVEALRRQNKELETEVKTLGVKMKKLAELEHLMEHRALKGDYDPTKTKVVSFTQNPCQLLRQQRSAEMKRLREEAETLRERVRVLEEGGAPSDDVTQVVAEKMKETANKGIEDLRKELSNSELHNQRLKEVFQQKIKEFREACYRLTGYQVNISTDNQYKLMSMYAERPNDVLLFQATPNGEMQLLENEFSLSLTHMIDSFLRQHASIPAFLSSVTLDLYSRQTMV